MKCGQRGKAGKYNDDAMQSSMALLDGHDDRSATAPYQLTWSIANQLSAGCSEFNRGPWLFHDKVRAWQRVQNSSKALK
jgi:hypothetical protein